MKRTNSLLSILFLLITAGCQNDFLDREPLAQISPNAFFRSEQDLQLYLNSLYVMFPSAEGIYNEDIDNIVKTSLSNELTGKRVTPVSGGGWDWDNLRKINYFLENYSKNLDPKVTAKYAGEAKFFRAYFYFGMVKRFGDVPWYSKTIEINDQANLTKARDPRTLVMDSVLADINYAVANLGTNKSSEKVTKWTALALKSRIGLYEGTFRKYHPEFNLPEADKFLREAAVAGEQLITEGPYKVYTSTSEKAYLELFSALNAIEDEVILAQKFSADLQLFHNVNYYTITASYGKPGLEKDLVNSYLMKDGSRFTDLPDYNKIPFFEETQNRDPRLSQTIRTPGYTRIGSSVQRVPEFGATVTGYQVIKFVTSEAEDSFTRSVNDMPVFRFGEVLLNYAEAKAELGELTQADLDKSLNLLRDRVAMPHLDLAAANANPDPFLIQQYKQVIGPNHGAILEIRRERRIELVMENYRWDDIIRWTEGHLLTRQYKGMFFPGPGSYDLDHNGNPDLVIYEGTKPTQPGPQYLKLGSEIDLENGTGGGLIVVNKNIPKVFDENKDYLYPLPIQEILLNQNLKQNPGWL